MLAFEHDLPLEILEHIFVLIPHAYIPRVRLVCRAWRDAAFPAFFQDIHINDQRLDESAALIAFLQSSPTACL